MSHVLGPCQLHLRPRPCWTSVHGPIEMCTCKKGVNTALCEVYKLHVHVHVQVYCTPIMHTCTLHCAHNSLKFRWHAVVAQYCNVCWNNSPFFKVHLYMYVQRQQHVQVRRTLQFIYKCSHAMCQWPYQKYYKYTCTSSHVECTFKKIHTNGDSW